MKEKIFIRISDATDDIDVPSYLTRGKLYEFYQDPDDELPVLTDDVPMYGYIVDDDGGDIYIRRDRCCHLNSSGSWELVEN